MDASLDRDLLVAELRGLRERGLLRLESAKTPVLVRCVDECGLSSAGRPLTAVVVELLRRVLARLDGDLRRAAELTLGTAQGMMDWPAQERRKRAAAVYGLSVERFRRVKEILVITHVAEQILVLCAENTLAPDAETVIAGLPPMESAQRYVLPAPGRVIFLTLRRGHIQALRNIDILVSSENVYLEMAKTFRVSLSSSLRNAAALRAPSGDVIDDVLPRELEEWQRGHGRLGIPVAAGTVVPTQAGELARQGIRRIYHAAVSVPERDSDDYHVDPGAVVRAVRGAFDLARQDRERLDPALRSICFPLFGAGRAGLAPEIAFEYLWPPLEAELRRHDGWEVHLITRGERGALAAVAGLSRRGASPTGPAPAGL